MRKLAAVLSSLRRKQIFPGDIDPNGDFTPLLSVLRDEAPEEAEDFIRVLVHFWRMAGRWVSFTPRQIADFLRRTDMMHAAATLTSMGELPWTPGMERYFEVDTIAGHVRLIKARPRLIRELYSLSPSTGN